MRRFSNRVYLTSTEHASGTDRIAEVVNSLRWGEDTVVVNLQGDEPMMPPGLLRQVASVLLDHGDADMATLAVPLDDPGQLFDSNVVKVVSDHAGQDVGTIDHFGLRLLLGGATQVNQAPTAAARYRR